MSILTIEHLANNVVYRKMLAIIPDQPARYVQIFLCTKSIEP